MASRMRRIRRFNEAEAIKPRNPDLLPVVEQNMRGFNEAEAIKPRNHHETPPRR